MDKIFTGLKNIRESAPEGEPYRAERGQILYNSLR